MKPPTRLPCDDLIFQYCCNIAAIFLILITPFDKIMSRKGRTIIKSNLIIDSQNV